MMVVAKFMSNLCLVESFMAKSGIKSKICKFYQKKKIELRG